MSWSESLVLVGVVVLLGAYLVLAMRFAEGSPLARHRGNQAGDGARLDNGQAG